MTTHVPVELSGEGRSIGATTEEAVAATPRAAASSDPSGGRWFVWYCREPDRRRNPQWQPLGTPTGQPFRTQASAERHADALMRATPGSKAEVRDMLHPRVT